MGKQFLLHIWHPSCYSWYKPDYKQMIEPWATMHVDIVGWYDNSQIILNVFLYRYGIALKSFHILDYTRINC